jgi:hypothetical protein
MKKRSITVSFECDANDDIIEEIAEQMKFQLESLNDGTLEMPCKGKCDSEYIVDEDYRKVKVTVK